MPEPTFPSVVSEDPAALYLDLLKRCLINWIYMDSNIRHETMTPFDAGQRLAGQDWPELAHTMIGLPRLTNLQECVETVIREGIPGDLMEAGVWRGGACILMRAILRARGVKDRFVWIADSFVGPPPPNLKKYPQDAGLDLSVYPQLKVSADQVRENFTRYDLLDAQVRILPGWFQDTLHNAPIDKLAVLRLDGDIYGSTLEALTHLFPKLSVGGFVIVDDYGAIPACRHAVDDYRRMHDVMDPITRVDWTGVYWRRS